MRSCCDGPYQSRRVTATTTTDTEFLVGTAILDAIAALRPSKDTVETKRAALAVELGRVEQEQARFVAAIAVAGDVDALAVAIKERERDRDRLKRELAALDGLAELSAFNPQTVERNLRKKLGEWRGLLRRQTPLSRQVLDRLLDGRIVWTPNREAGLYEFAGHVRFDRLLHGVVFTQGGASRSVPSWNTIHAWLRELALLEESLGSVA